MRVTLLPVLVAALAFISPIVAQDTSTDDGNGDSTDTPTDSSTDTSTDPNAGATMTSAPSATSSDSGSTDGGNTGDPGIAPSEPSPESSFNIGTDITATWNNTDVGTDQWTNMTIELMTGSNYNMIHLSYVATKINAMTSTSYSFKAPDVHPTSKIYFLQL